MKHGPWTSGPRELLDHAHDHLAKGSDFDHRIAMISVDNAVELMLKTYVDLPKRVTGLSLTRKERNEYTADFPSALAAVEALVPERLSGIDLGEIEWFHRTRNRLYHESDATTVGGEQVERYLKHAERLMGSLFSPTHERPPAAQRKLTQQKFFKRLRQKAGPSEVDVARRLLNELRAMGLEAKWGTGGFSARLRTQLAPKPLLTMLVVTTDGTAYVGWLTTQLKRLGLPHEIAREYYERASKLFDDCSVKTQPAGDLAWTRSIALAELEREYDEFIAILRETTDRLRAESRAYIEERQRSVTSEPRTARATVHAAVKALLSQPGKETFTPSEVYQEILKSRPDFNKGTNSATIISDCVNCTSRRHYQGGQRDRYFNIRRGVYRLYDPDQDGTWDHEGKPV